MNRNYSIIEKKGTHGNISIDKMADAASGIVVNDECKMKYLELKAKRNYRFIIFKIQETIQQVVIEKLGEPNDKYENLIASLPLDECRYAIFDLDGDYRKSKTVFIAWSPDSSRVRSKMLYACSKDRFIKELDGVQIELQANDVTKKDRSRLEVKQVISSTSKMCFPMRKFRANNNRRLLDFGRSIDFQYMLLVLYLAKFTSVLLFDKLNRKKVKNSGKIIGSVVAENMNWLKKCAVGWMKEFLPVGMIIEEIKKEGIVTVEIKRMEGDMVLLYFENELEVQRLEEENWVSLLKIFKKVEKWSENLTVSKRSTWISCFGVPVHCWNIDTFRDIANRVGEFIEIDKDTKIMKTFTRGNIHIYTDKKQRIEELMELQVGNCVHNIRVVEIENDCISNLSCCCGNFFQQSNETLSYSDEPMVKSYVHGEIGGEDHETGKSEVEDDDVLNHDVLKKSVCDEICIRDKLSPRLSEVGDVEDKLSHMTNNTDANSVALSEIEAGRVDDNSVVNHLSEDQETRRKSEITDMKLKFFDDLDDSIVTQKAEMEEIKQERKNGRSFEVRVSDSIDREAEEVSKFDNCGGLYVDCDDNVILKEFVRGLITCDKTTFINRNI